MSKSKSATEAVVKHLQRHKQINQLQCIERYGTWRLSSIIYRLRKSGMDIISQPKKVKTRYKKTVLVTNYRLN